MGSTHLVENEQHAVLVAQRTQRGEEARWRCEEAALSQDGLDDDGSSLLQCSRAGLGLKWVLG